VDVEVSILTWIWMGRELGVGFIRGMSHPIGRKVMFEFGI
jgi:hypothetical protein